MISQINHDIQLVRGVLRHTGSTTRSAEWPKVEKAFREKNPICACCGGQDRLNVHHVHPFHLYPELELVESNLITLCMGMERHCHILVGHGDDFKAFNPLVVAHSKKVADIAIWRGRGANDLSSKITEVAAEARSGRLYARISES